MREESRGACLLIALRNAGYRFRPVSGLAGEDPSFLVTAPSHAGAQWRFAVPRPAYRCGGSAGLAAALSVGAERTGFPFKPFGERRRVT
jgi:hypothetical protein